MLEVLTVRTGARAWIEEVEVRPIDKRSADRLVDDAIVMLDTALATPSTMTRRLALMAWVYVAYDSQLHLRIGLK